MNSVLLLEAHKNSVLMQNHRNSVRTDRFRVDEHDGLPDELYDLDCEAGYRPYDRDEDRDDFRARMTQYAGALSAHGM